jgi:hypothetical protein
MAALSISIPEPQSFDGLPSLNGRCAVVTSGKRGLGEAINAGRRRGRVYGTRALQRVEADVSAVGGKALGVQADIGRIEGSHKR